MSEYTLEGHNFNWVVAGKTFCSKCGLMYSQNAFTQWAIDKGCNYYLLTSQLNSKRKLTNPFKE